MEQVGVTENKEVDNSELYRRYQELRGILPQPPSLMSAPVGFNTFSHHLPVPPVAQTHGDNVAEARLIVPTIQGSLEGDNITQARPPLVPGVPQYAGDRGVASGAPHDVSPDENGASGVDDGQEGDGFIFESKWKLAEDLSIGYIIRFDIRDPGPDHQIEVDDVFVDLDEAVKLLSSVSKGSKVTIKPPKIQTIWTIRVDSEERDYCPLTEFVYHAALKATGKKFRKVYNGILSCIISNLYRSGEYKSKNRPVLKSYNEKSEMFPKGEEEESMVKCELREGDEPLDGMGWSDVEDFLDKEQQGEDDEDQMKDDDVKMEADDYNYSPPPVQASHSKRRKLKNEYSDEESDDSEFIEEEEEEVKPKKARKPRTTIPKKEKSLISHVGGGRHPKGASPIKGNLVDIHERQTIKTEQGELFVCGLSLCGHQFERFLSLVEHERSHLDSFICILCGECCFSAEKLISHSDLRHPEKTRHICRVCGFFTRKASWLKSHVQQVHMQGSVIHQCEECEFTTEKIQTLRAHKRAMHSNEEHFCDICGKSYGSAPSLYVHKKLHDPDFKKFKCSLCDKRFAFSSGLSYHMTTHTGERPFACMQCDATFGSNTALSRHTNVVHAQEKDFVYECEHCGKKFQRRKVREYKDHVKIHTGERDHICSICGSSYFSRKQLRKHERKKHPHLIAKRVKPIQINPDSVPQITVQTRPTPFLKRDHMILE